MTHTVFAVAVADHEASAPAWRVRHAAETIANVLAYFTTGSDGAPVQAADGTFEVHAPSAATLGTLRRMLVEHEGLSIVREEQAPGTGIIAVQ